MPIDAVRCARVALPDIPHNWSRRDVLLYHLGVGAGWDPMDSGSRRYGYEKDLRVLPSYSSCAVLPALLALPTVPGFDVPLRNLLHAEQRLTVHKPLPPEGRATTSARILAIHDSGRNAIVELEAVTVLEGETEAVATNNISVFVRGEQVGIEGPPANPITLPERKADLRVERETVPWQALLYRLSGDMNSVHADPEVAASVGFERPILQGLCTYGMVLHDVVEHLGDGASARVTTWRSRFTSPVFPGERLATEVWHEGDQEIVRTTAVKRGVTALIGTLDLGEV